MYINLRPFSLSSDVACRVAIIIIPHHGYYYTTVRLLLCRRAIIIIPPRNYIRAAPLLRMLHGRHLSL